MVVLAATCDRAALLTDYVIAEKVSGLGFLLLAAVYISSASSCLATLYGTPRVLQSIASENSIPAIAKLAEGVSVKKSYQIASFKLHTVRNLHFLPKNSTLISRENCRFFG